MTKPLDPYALRQFLTSLCPKGFEVMKPLMEESINIDASNIHFIVNHTPTRRSYIVSDPKFNHYLYLFERSPIELSHPCHILCVINALKVKDSVLSIFHEEYRKYVFTDRNIMKGAHAFQFIGGEGEEIFLGDNIFINAVNVPMNFTGIAYSQL